MILANYHTHTTRCKHAVGTEREYIETMKNCFAWAADMRDL
jgi:histidinol-phosphatase (PHP family)